MFFNISKNFSLMKIGHLGRIIGSQNKEVLNSYESCCKKNIIGVSVNLQVPVNRSYSTEIKEDPSPDNILPPLTDDDIKIVPGLFKTFSSIFYLQGHIRRYDATFDVPEFVTASKQAVETVSHFLSGENYEALEGLVTDDIIQKLRRKICTLTASQKELIAIRKDDIYGHFPYTISMLYQGEGDNKKAYAEIFMVYYSLRGLKELRERNINPPLQMGLMPEYRDKIFVSNYRFIRDFTNGSDEPWIINLCNEVMLLAYK